MSEEESVRVEIPRSIWIAVIGLLSLGGFDSGLRVSHFVGLRNGDASQMGLADPAASAALYDTLGKVKRIAAATQETMDAARREAVAIERLADVLDRISQKLDQLEKGQQRLEDDHSRLSDQHHSLRMNRYGPGSSTAPGATGHAGAAEPAAEEEG